MMPRAFASLRRLRRTFLRASSPLVLVVALLAAAAVGGVLVLILGREARGASPDPARAVVQAAMPVQPLSLSPAEKAYLKALGPVRFCVDPDWEPYEWIDAQGAYQGIAADLVRLIAARSGVELSLVPTHDWSESLATSRRGDCLALAFLNETPEREAWLVFTDAYFTDPNVFITRADHGYIADPSRLSGQTMVLPAGTGMEERMRARYPNLAILIVDSEREALAAVEDGSADLTLRSLTMAAYVIRKQGLFNLRISGQLPELEDRFRIGVAKGEPLLRDILNRGIATLTPLEVDAAINAHIAIEARTAVDWRPLFWTVGGIALLFVLWLFWNLSLMRHMRHLRLIIDTVPAFIFVKDSMGRYLLANRWMATAFGRSPEEVEGLTDRDCGATEEEIEAYLAEDRLVLEKGEEFHIPEHPGRRVDRSPGWFRTVKVPYRRPGSKAKAILGVTVDITELKRAGLELEERERRFRHMAQHDPLTDLPNRALFADRLGQALVLCRREGTKLALVYVDLDHFKEVNDRLGHGAGDLLLTQAAGRMTSALRASDTVGRVGGDEFVLFLRGVEDRAAVAAAVEKIRVALRSPFDLDGQAAEVSGSIGVALFPEDGTDETTLARRADAAMYRSKALGRDRISFFDPTLDGAEEAPRPESP